MYVPDHYRIDDVGEMHGLMRTRPFAALVSARRAEPLLAGDEAPADLRERVGKTLAELEFADVFELAGKAGIDVETFEAELIRRLLADCRPPSGRATPADAADEDRDAMSRRIERVIVDECIGPATTAVAELRRQSGVARAEFVFLAVEHPGIPDAEILDKLLDAGSVLLTGIACCTTWRSAAASARSCTRRKPV